jgi:hypothetical protein
VKHRRLLAVGNFWMVTERQARGCFSIMCRDEDGGRMPEVPQAVMPLGDLESFLINYTQRRSGRSTLVADDRLQQGGRSAGTRRVKERKQLHDQEEEIEKSPL